MADGRKVVWILGAGFSRSLGGPLLIDLLSPRSRDSLKGEFEDVLFLGGRIGNSAVSNPELLFANFETDVVYGLYRYGLKEAVWQDAEQFLDYLDAQTNKETSTADLISLIMGASKSDIPNQFDPELLNRIARRLVAAQCCAFLRHNPTALERWQPYVRWLSAMRHSDDCYVQL